MASKEFHPQILYRVFGKQSIQDLLPICTARQTGRFTILTTTDYPKENVLEMRRAGFEVIEPTFTNEQAGQNSAGFLNHGLGYLNEQGHKCAMLMASGYQSQLTWIDNCVFKNAFRDFPDQDIYFALTPDVHGKFSRINEDGLPLYENRGHFFPSESLAVVKIKSVYPLNETMTMKGAMGLSKKGHDLGGIELMLTAMEIYKSRRGGKVLEMCAIMTPIKRESEVMAFGNEVHGYALKERGAPVEFTSNEVKQQRRKETIDAARRELGMSVVDYRNMFSKTKMVEWGF